MLMQFYYQPTFSMRILSGMMRPPMRNRYTRFTIRVFTVLLLLVAVRGVFAQAAKSPLPSPTGYVNDYANVIDPATKQRMETILQNLKQRADIEFAVVTVKTTGDTPIFDYSLAVARGWGIGSREGEKNGLLLVVAVDDRKSQIQVSRHLEGDLPDGLVGATLRNMRPFFQQNDYSKGLMAGVQTVVATLAQARGFNIEGIDQSYAYRGGTQATNNAGSSTKRAGGGMSICGIIIIIVIIILILSAFRRGGGGGCLNLLLLNALFNSGSGGGSSGGWSSGGGGDSGGFGGFGGGGDFGGGGAGDSW